MAFIGTCGDCGVHGILDNHFCRPGKLKLEKENQRLMEKVKKLEGEVRKLQRLMEKVKKLEGEVRKLEIEEEQSELVFRTLQTSTNLLMKMINRLSSKKERKTDAEK